MNKIRYCKYCGGQIDSKTKICTKCGKNFAKFKKIALFTYIIISIFAITSLSTLFVLYYNKTDNLVTENNDLNKEIVEIKGKYKELHDSFDKISYNYDVLQDDYNNIKLELNYYQKDFAYVTPNGEKYHKPTCNTLNNSDEIFGDTIWFWESKGYKKCSICY